MTVDSVYFERGTVGSVALPGKVRASVKRPCPPGVCCLRWRIVASGVVLPKIGHIQLKTQSPGKEERQVLLCGAAENRPHSVKTPHSPRVRLV